MQSKGSEPGPHAGGVAAWRPSNDLKSEIMENLFNL
jgi:hypothetical protein